MARGCPDGFTLITTELGYRFEPVSQSRNVSVQPLDHPNHSLQRPFPYFLTNFGFPDFPHFLYVLGVGSYSLSTQYKSKVFEFSAKELALGDPDFEVELFEEMQYDGDMLQMILFRL